ncbi:MAG: ferrous iron transporter B [Acidobacteriota bacterium]|jgi:ferrous iron transport protein B|nr:ferrous iron transporter B [Acidobacteriota bacterium]
MVAETASAPGKIVLVGNPNVGKSVTFRILTGNYVLVSNFPGTTVEVSRGRMQLGGREYEVVDTPGVNSLIPQSEDERVTCEILLREKPDVIVQVADAKNLRRTILVTSQLAEFGVPMVLVLNMIDEAEDRGIDIDAEGISKLFGIPVVETIAIYSKGKRKLQNAILGAASKPANPVAALLGEKKNIPPLEGLESMKAPALLAVEWLAEGNREFNKAVNETLGADVAVLERWRERCQGAGGAGGHGQPARAIGDVRNLLLEDAVASFKKKHEVRLKEGFHAPQKLWMGLLLCGLLFFAWNEIGALLRLYTPYSFFLGKVELWLGAVLPSQDSGLSFVRGILGGVEEDGHFQFGLVPGAIHFLFFIAPVLVPLGVLLGISRGFAHRLGVLARQPATGIPILVGVLLLLYEFVGFTGAQLLVGLIEEVFFGQYLVPFLQSVIPAGLVFDLLVGEYGLISMGLSYAIGIVLPVVGAFFIAFGLLEDSGYIPRLSILSDRLMRIMGLNGKAVLPMVLGFGCGTMAVMSVRILNSKRERFIATLLLALGIPCSAQLGVMMGIASSFSVTAVLTVVAVVAAQLLLVGWLASKVVRGRPSEFIFEIPPIRTPQLKNVALKTWYRIQWYLKEAAPLFLLGTLILFLLDRIHLAGQSLMEWIQRGMEPLIVGLLHLPTETAGVFLLGFLRRDYGAAGLYAMARADQLDGQQIVVSLATITLFIPCVASFFMIIREQGVRRALGIAAFITVYAIIVGTVLSWVLRTLGIQF